MKALTIRQPWASLIAAGVKTIETRSWSTRYRGPLAIHAGLAWAPGFSMRALWHDPDVDTPERDRNDLLVEKLRCEPFEDINGSGWWTVDRYGRGHVPLGAVVATCTLADVVPTDPLDWPGKVNPYTGWAMNGDGSEASLDFCGSRGKGRRVQFDWDEQRPFGDFIPGRYAWLLTDVQPLAEPIPAKGRQGLWGWEA